MTTVVPWWREAATPTHPPVARHTRAVPDDVAHAMVRAAARAAVDAQVVAAAAHARVLAALTGEVDIATGVLLEPGGQLGDRTVRELRLAVAGTWRGLVTTAGRAAATGTALLTPPESVFASTATDLSGLADRLACPLLVHLRTGADPCLVEVYYRTDRFDAAHAGRIAGYLIRAIQAATHLDTPAVAVDLLAAEERQAQVFGIGAGRQRVLPERMPHELFVAAAQRHPDRTALLHRGRRYTYRELHAAAAQVASALRDRGLATGDVVALVADRGFRWAAGLLGILSAGGVYLPLETGWQPARMGGILARSGCRWVLAQAGVRVADSMAADLVLRLESVLSAPRPAETVVERAAGDQAAYIYFTSGSTGQPKGALCEHRGMLNHLQAKIDDLQLGSDDVVVQNADASFDISLWQLVAPLLVGGASLVVDRETVTDVPRFLAEILAHGASVLQVVPSYLEVLLSHLASRPRPLGRLRWLSVTGEAVPRSLVARWLESYPTVPVVNAYGATEASDDTTHEIISAPPPGERMPVGRPVGNVTVYVLEPGRDRLLPLGAVGEIAFSGICVGRGYVNDPERTAEAFHNDPFRPGERMYRTGDFGRWLPAGSLEFHGRRDEQVKVRGHRIELGEVEACLLAHPQVRTARVVATPGADGSTRLTAFYTGGAGIGSGELAAWVGSRLVPAAVPAEFRCLGSLPLTSNGKVDTRALAGLAQAPPSQPPAPAPLRGNRAESPTQRRIAQVWAEALRREVNEIGPDDDFFALGGTSLAALRVVADLDGLVALPDLMRTPKLRELAALVDATPQPVPAGGS